MAPRKLGSEEIFRARLSASLWRSRVAPSCPEGDDLMFGNSPFAPNGLNHSLRCRTLNAVQETQTLSVENEIIEYLHYHRHDLPRAIWIER